MADSRRTEDVHGEVGLDGPFSFVKGHTVAVTTSLRERLMSLIEPLLASLGYELVELEYVPGRRQGLVRIYIDRHEGIGLEDCERASHEVSALLDTTDPVPGAYALEVSSPGFERVLRTRAHFERFTGSRVHVELVAPRAGRRRYTGSLMGVDDDGIHLEVDRERVDIPFGEIGRARLREEVG